MDRIEKYLKNMIFREISFVLNDKTIKQGKIHMFNVKQNFIKFKIEMDGEIKEWEISYPYDVKTSDDGYVFDYSLSAFCPRTEESYWKMMTMKKNESSKFFNNYLFVLTS
jgi:hypothetical protein